jgi:hypothetical protein
MEMTPCVCNERLGCRRQPVTVSNLHRNRIFKGQAGWTPWPLKMGLKFVGNVGN